MAVLESNLDLPVDRCVAGPSISPELVLVDPTLAWRARLALGLPGIPTSPEREARSATPHFAKTPGPSRPRDVVATVSASSPQLEAVALTASLPPRATVESDPAREPPAARSDRWHADMRRGSRVLISCACISAALFVPSSAPGSQRHLAPPSSGDIPGAGDARPTRARVAIVRPPRAKQGRASRSLGASRKDSQTPKRARPAGTGARKSALGANQATPSSLTAGRSFAWAPFAGARGYVVSFRRGSQLVYMSRTTDAKLELPRRWKLKGHWTTLTPGTYRWDVWPVLSNGTPVTKAIVEARLTVASRQIPPREGQISPKRAS